MSASNHVYYEDIKKILNLTFFAHFFLNFSCSHTERSHLRDFMPLKQKIHLKFTHGKANTAGTPNRPSYIQVTPHVHFWILGGINGHFQIEIFTIIPFFIFNKYKKSQKIFGLGELSSGARNKYQLKQNENKNCLKMFKN
ncbi:hypothetical protein BpHYR1_015558 [Brachionus plicatilis]|uniref:Uncharacterized protein n=1 Tax=Brachionus plicatilis TaxID=10195 RepID=A0A3M7S4U4_BRAPC|nr:hypothetical protein BpHYR1_015558 [Brachionus plicatilis]